MLKKIVGICLFISLIGTGHCLDCYNCSVSSSTYDDDACNGLSSVRTCPGFSVCLTATYEVKSGSVTTHTYMQSCFQDTAGQECYHFYKSQRDLHRTAHINPITCYVCRHDNCNRYKNGGNTLRVEFVTLLISLVGFSLSRLVVFY